MPFQVLITEIRDDIAPVETARPVRQIAILLAALFAGLASTGPVGAQQVKIGIVVPLTGSTMKLGEQLRTGAEIAVRSGGASPVVVDDGCSKDGGAAAASKLAAEQVAIVVGFLCSEAIEAALPILTAVEIPVITPGVRTDSLTDRRAKTGWPVYRVAPRADEERMAIADILVRRWSDKLFAIVDDGTIYGRELAESFRLSAEQAGLKPVFTDTYRPQFDNQIGLAGRLRSAGATHVFAGGNRDDIAILGRDAAVIGFAATIAGGEALRAAPGEVDLAPGTLMVGLPETRDIATPKFVQSLQSAGNAAEGYALGGYAAAEIALDAVKLSTGTETSLMDVLSATTFKTAAGTIKFDAKGDRVGNPYRLFRYDGNEFAEVR